MKEQLFISILQLLSGNPSVPFNSSCEDVVAYEKSTGNFLTSIKEGSNVVSFDKENRVLWMYNCNPKNWSISVSEGSFDRDIAEEKYSYLFDLVSNKYGNPELTSTKENDEFGSFAHWNIDDKNLAELLVDNSFFERGVEDKWSVKLSIKLNRQAQCGDLFQTIPCKNK